MDKRTFLAILDDARKLLDAMPDGELDSVTIGYRTGVEFAPDNYDGAIIEVDRADGWILKMKFDAADYADDADEAVATVADATPSPWGKLERCCLDGRPAVATEETARG